MMVSAWHDLHIIEDALVFTRKDDIHEKTSKTTGQIIHGKYGLVYYSSAKKES